MSAQEVIDQIKHLSPGDRARVVRFVVESDGSTASNQYAVVQSGDGLPVIRGDGGIITSRLVRELESMTV